MTGSALTSPPGFENVIVTDLGIQTFTDEESGERWPTRLLAFSTTVDELEHGMTLSAAPDVEGAVLDSLIRHGCQAVQHIAADYVARGSS